MTSRSIVRGGVRVDERPTVTVHIGDVDPAMCAKPEASMALGMRLATAIRHCADRESALRVSAELIGRELGIASGVWRAAGDPPVLVFAGEHGLATSHRRRLLALAKRWTAGDRRASLFQLSEVFGTVTGSAEPSVIDLNCGVLLLAERCVEVEGSRRELAELITALPDSTTMIFDASGEPTDARPDASQAERVMLASLTSREREVLVLLVGGLDTRKIAEHLVISTKTVKTHVQNILAKLAVTSRLEAAALGRRNGISPQTAL